jgi:nucleoside 2-deoxyribosyltransferase
VATRRVDRIEHNDDIDDRIIAEIEKADLVITDLTYARPSVYFEAGYAQRAIPVVYTVRGDHFRARDADPHGNRQVHFDLKMRNIIAWS